MGVSPFGNGPLGGAPSGIDPCVGGSEPSGVALTGVGEPSAILVAAGALVTADAAAAAFGVARGAGALGATAKPPAVPELAATLARGGNGDGSTPVGPAYATAGVVTAD